MADDATATAAATDTNAQTPAATPPATPAPAATPPAAPADQSDPAWLASRLARKQEQLLKDLGVESVDAAKAAIAKAAELEEASKTEIQRLTDKVEAAAAVADQLKSASERLERYAQAELAKLTAAQRTAVDAIIGDDIQRAPETIAALRPTWSAMPDDAPAVAAPAALPAPASTAATPAAPPPATSTPIDHKAAYAQLMQTNPLRAGQYLLAHRADIYPTQ